MRCSLSLACKFDSLRHCADHHSRRILNYSYLYLRSIGDGRKKSIDSVVYCISVFETVAFKGSQCRPNAVYLDGEKSPAMADAAIKSLACYAEKELWGIYYDTPHAEMFLFIADFVQRVFLLRPMAALFFGLDLVCEGLIRRVKVWEEKAARKRDVDKQDIRRQEAELATLVLPFSRARRAYAAASRARHETLQYTSGVGWWKQGGLSKSCEALGSTMA
ncbi:hypothetical protein FRB95_013963 [Tulasnella sp. JGI-2019a]|nr:hypothetical protein FRB95_013963 [Tulasnella sp. JGI-2019a]